MADLLLYAILAIVLLWALRAAARAIRAEVEEWRLRRRRQKAWASFTMPGIESTYPEIKVSGVELDPRPALRDPGPDERPLSPRPPLPSSWGDYLSMARRQGFDPVVYASIDEERRWRRRYAANHGD